MDESTPEGLEPTLSGEFVHAGSFERSAELKGRGSITVTENGLRIVASTVPMVRRTNLFLLEFVVLSVAGLAAATAEIPATAILGGLLVAAVAGGVLVLRATRIRAFEALVPWRGVKRAGISNGVLTFQLSAPRSGTARFRVPGYGLKELTPIAREIVKRSTGS